LINVRHYLPVIACWIIAGATVVGNSPSLRQRIQLAVKNYGRWDSQGFNGMGDYLQTRREAVRSFLPQGEALYFYVPDGKSLSSTQRSMHIAMTWEAMPDKVCYGGTNGIAKADYIVSSVYKGALPIKDGTFLALRKSDHGSIWGRASIASTKPPRQAVPVARWRELLGLAAPCLVMIGGVAAGGWVGLSVGLLLFTLCMAVPPLLGFAPSFLFVSGAGAFSVMGATLATRQQRQNVEPHPFPLSLNKTIILGFIGLALFFFYTFLTLSHTFMTPNGLGVFGGKAKLLYLSGGIPPGFFTDGAWATLQPAYPPGFALLTLGCYGLAGSCGEHLTQLLSCLFIGCALFFIGVKIPQRRPLFLPVILLFTAAFLAEQAIWTGIFFYAEPWMLLVILVAVDAIIVGVEREEKSSILPWILLGSCGWIKNEGMIYLPAVWLAMRFIHGASRVPFKVLGCGLILPLSWTLFSRLAGATLYDFAPLWQIDWHQAWLAAKAIAKLAFLEPWRYGFAYPIAIIILVITPFRTGRVVVGLLVMLVNLLAFIAIFSISRATDFEWHLDSLERLLWIPAILFLFIVATSSKGKTRQRNK
jgi:hypothetical protein